MKNCILIPVLLIVVAFSQEIYSATRLSLIRSTKDFTHKWVYLPSGEDMTRDGIKNNMYPLVLTPVETSLQSEPINIEGQDLGVTIRYSVTTLLTSAIKFELIDENGAVLYSYIENGHEINEETMTVGDTHDIGIIEGAKKVQIRLSLSKAVLAQFLLLLNNYEKIYTICYFFYRINNIIFKYPY